MPITEAFAPILRELLVRAGEGDWAAGADDDTFLLSRSAFGIAITREFNPSAYRLTLYNGNGQYIDSCSVDSSENAKWTDGWEPGPEYKALEKIWTEARRIALNVDDIFRSAVEGLRALNGENPPDGFRL